ncbi:MAG: tetratricopeptide repeat protein, partial [Leptolyngbyaceae cyanobacterium]
MMNQFWAISSHPTNCFKPQRWYRATVVLPWISAIALSSSIALVSLESVASRPAIAQTIASAQEDEIRRLQSEAFNYSDAGNLEAAVDSLEAALDISQASGDRLNTLETATRLGELYYQLEDWDRMQEAVQLAVQMVEFLAPEATPGSVLEAQIHRTFFGIDFIAFQLKRDGEVQEAIAYYQYALTIARSIGDLEQEIQSLQGIASAYASISDYDQALNYAN